MSLESFFTLGRSGLRVSPLTLGTITFGDEQFGADEQTSFAILDAYIAAGGNILDTANVYAGGRSEEIIGAYLARNPSVRDKLVVATKFGSALAQGDPHSGGASRKAIVHQLEASLRRLGTDYVDLYWQHVWDRHTPTEETVSAMNDLVRQGKVRYLGLSGTPAWAVAQASTIAQFRGWAPIVALQVEYSLLQRTIEGEIFGAAQEFGLGITPYSPLASGVLSGKYTRENTSPAGSGRATLAAAYLNEKTFDVLDVLRRISDEQGGSVAATALAWVRRQTPITSTIIGARTVDQLNANLASLEVNLADSQVQELSKLTQPQLNNPYHTLDATIAWQQGGTTINGVAAGEAKGLG